MVLNNEWVNIEIKEEIKRYLETNENENTAVQNLWDTGKGVLRRKFIALQAFLKKTRKISNKQSNNTLKGTWKRSTKTKPTVSKKKGNNEDQNRNK